MKALLLRLRTFLFGQASSHRIAELNYLKGLMEAEHICLNHAIAANKLERVYPQHRLAYGGAKAEATACANEIRALIDKVAA
jgi:hypothetical protein